jgi:hypothetical protein
MIMMIMPAIGLPKSFKKAPFSVDLQLTGSFAVTVNTSPYSPASVEANSLGGQISSPTYLGPHILDLRPRLATTLLHPT